MKPYILPFMCLAAGCASFDPANQIQPTYSPPSVVQTQSPKPQPSPVNITPGRTMRPTVKGAITVFPFEDGKIFPISVSPNYLTAIHLEPGEQMPGSAAIGDPDPAHWLVQKTAAGSKNGMIVIILIKAASPGLKTNLMVPTSRRTYQLDLVSQAKRGMDIIRFSYEDDTQDVKLPSETEPTIDPARLNHNYTIEALSGDRPAWAPLAAFDFGGPKSYVEFPYALGGNIPSPAMFIVDGNSRSPAPLRVRGKFFEVDRLFTSADLQIGDSVVRISRR